MYTIKNMRDAIPPAVAWDIPQSLEAFYIFKVRKHLGADIVPSHDPDYWKNKPLAPKVFKVSSKGK
jgi:hypothetical protein